MKISSVKILWGLIIICFALIEFPGIFFINRYEPAIMNIPFLYWFPFMIWAVLCLLLFVGYKMGWKSRKR